MKLDHPDLQSRLAAEYVLGTMRGAARRRFARDVATNPTLQQHVAEWQARMTPLAERVSPVTPAARVWTAIEQHLFDEKRPVSAGVSSQKRLETPVPSRVSSSIWTSLGFWRALGVAASSACALLLVALVMVRSSVDDDPMRVAILEDKGVARMLIEQPSPSLLQVKMVKPWQARETDSFQLWVLPQDGPPRSIGLITQDGSTRIAVKELEAMLDGGLQFAVSREPRGGSPTGAPTGAILCKGVIARLPARTSNPPASAAARGPI